MNQEQSNNKPQYYIAGNYETELQHIINEKAKDLPILGTKNYKQDVLLFHYSTKNDISEFRRNPGIFCWTDTLSENFGWVSRTTQCVDHEQFCAIYFIRVGITSRNSIFIESPIIKDSNKAPAGVEYELNKNITADCFCKLIVNPDEENRIYRLSQS